MKKLLSLIVPCFNEEEVLLLFYSEVTKVLETIDIDYELVLVNDGSKDCTLDKMIELASKDNRVKYFSLSRNFGKESAMYAGLCNAKGDYVGFIDSDLQHPPILMKDMLAVLETGNYDCAACKRVNRTGDSKIRTWFARKFYKIVNSISDAEMVDGAGDYRIMTRKMVEAIITMNEHNRFSKGLFSWIGFNTYWIDYENVDRAVGKTSWSFIKLVEYAITGIVSFSNIPLVFSAWIGVLIIIISIIYIVGILIVGKYELVKLILFVVLMISGIQLLSLGIIGQYIGNIYSESKNRPHFIISKTNDKDAIKIK